MTSYKCSSLNEDSDSFEPQKNCLDKFRMAVIRGPTLYEFLLETELSHYFSPLKNELKVNSVAQLKYVEEEDLAQLGMSKPEQRRLRKYFQKYYPQTYLRKIKNMILPKNKDDSDRTSLYVFDSCSEKSSIKVPSKHIIPMDHIVLNKQLGVGEFGVVQQGVWTNEDGERIQVAIKCLSEERMQKNHMEFLKEAAIMHTIDHENIVRLYGVVLETNALMLVTELAPLRSLLECLKEPALRPSFPIVSLCEFTLQICDGMQYLENKKLIHRDLAARNVLVFAKNKIKISDFGLSRALGVGKDYYQTNFNVNLKLPIAWCAPECINYLRFTSASDVWAYGVTMWEMFSYGFQPWAALTGQQILEAIDDPNFQRLEQPECCPKEYYTLMLKCWQHEASQRPKFSEIYQFLPECKPEQVQAICDTCEIFNNTSKSKRDWLHYQTGDIITVLDKRPVPDSQNVWKGILNNGKTGLFDPAHTVAYFGQNIPTTRPSFSRLDGKTGIYASQRRLRREMISSPQGDFKHTGHVGLDGAFFGDISFLGDKYHQLPKQVVSPYKPQDDRDNASPTITCAPDSSDRIPLLTNPLSDGKSPTEAIWTDCSWEKNGSKDAENASVTDKAALKKLVPGRNGRSNTAPDHEYHEISDDDSFELVENSKFESLDLGPSLMDEVFRALGTTKPDIEYDEKQCNENNNVKNEIKEITSKVGREGSKKKQALVKPISAADQQTLDSAIAMAKELASKSMLELDSRSDGDTPLDSPKTPTSPFKRKFSFKFKTSPKPDRRNFSEEAEAIPDIQDIITDEAKEVYNSLVEKGHGFEKGLPVPTAAASDPIQETGNVCCQTFSHQPQPCLTQNNDSCNPESEVVEANPLRMLRSGVPVRPKVRGNRHGIPGSGRATTPHTATVARLAANAASSTSVGTNCTRPNLGSPPPPPPSTKSASSSVCMTGDQRSNVSNSENVTHSKTGSGIDTSSGGQHSHSASQSSHGLPTNMSLNPLPLPPRDRSKPLPVLKQHQRKHPLILPSSGDILEAQCALLMKQVSCPDVPTQTKMPTEVERRASEGGIDTCFHVDVCSFEDNSNADSLSSDHVSNSATAPPPKPARTLNLDDSFESQIQAEIESLDNIPEEESQTLYKGGDHVSCEDLLEFALDKPNSRRTQGRASGINSDEVRIMQKVLAGEVSAEDCLVALNETDWDMHKAIKLIRLQCVLRTYLIPHDNWKQILVKCNWNVQQATDILLSSHNVAEDTTEV